MMEKTSGLTAATVAVILVISVAVSPVIFNDRVQAAAVKGIQGSGTGTVTCADGTQVNNVHLDFSVQKLQGRIISPNSGATFTFQGGIFGTEAVGGFFVQGKVGSQAYNLQGVASTSLVCNTAPPIDFFISGACGPAVKIGFTTTSTDGERGEFTGNVACV